MVLVALACSINVGMISVLFKNMISKRLIFIMLVVVNFILVLTLIFGITFGLLLNISGMLLYFISFISVGRAWWKNHKTAGPVFAAFWFYLLSAPFFSSARILSGMGSVLGIYNFVCPLGELIFYIVTLFAFFVRYADSYVKSLSQIELMGVALSDKDRSLSQAYEKLSDFEAARTRIFRDLTHDLRTPITSVLGYLSMISEGEISDPADVQSISGRMLLRIRQIKEMINSISGLTNIEQGHIKMNIESCPASDILSTVLAHYEPRCADAAIEFSVSLDIKACVMADTQQIMRVFDNLISNAIRYTPEGGSITVEAFDEGQTVRFSVTDTGRGIAKEQLPYIFERFYRAEPSRSDTYMHQGLGLSICHEIIKAHGGTIEVQSDPSTGSRFSFTLLHSQKER
jgi:signal transduction histidine kinase